MRSIRNNGLGIRERGVVSHAERHSRRSTVSGQSLNRARRQNRGLSLIEVLVSMAILLGGVLGMAALMSVGKLELVRTENADRTGSCGRAAMQAVKIRKMLDPNLWYLQNDAAGTTTFFIDPLGRLNISGTSGTSLAGFPRISLKTSGTATSPMDLTQAQAIFLLQDEISVQQPDDFQSGTNLSSYNGQRPYLPGTIEGHYSWFATVGLSPMEVNVPLAQRRNYTVSVVVVKDRLFTTGGTESGEYPYTGGSAAVSPSYGGLTVSFNTKIDVSDGQWVFLYGSQTAWYRVVCAGYNETNNTTWLTLAGPDWYGGTSSISMLVVRGVTGVYTTNIKLDNDGTWGR